MKTVFRSDEIAHIWAHQSAPEGRCPASMSFMGPSFYSYQTEMARHIERKGRKAILLNDTSYSITTSGHQSQLRRAIPEGVPIFHIGGIDMGCSLSFDGRQLFEYAVKQAADCASKAARARRNQEWHLGQQAKWLEEAKEINAFFGLRRKVDEKTIERLKEAQEASARKEAARQKARMEKERIEQTAAFEAWKANQPHEYFNARAFPVAFRVEGEELVSTLGARVPLHDARVAYRFARAHASGWQRNGQTCPVGPYQLDSISQNGIIAGCHRISWEEIERLALVLA